MEAKHLMLHSVVVLLDPKTMHNNGEVVCGKISDMGLSGKKEKNVQRISCGKHLKHKNNTFLIFA